MATPSFRVLFVGVLTIFYYSQAQILPTFFENTFYDDSISENITVFEKGDIQVAQHSLKKSAFYTPEPLLIVSPNESGVYPVLLFIHGTMISNEDYSKLFEHIASHGYIVVAPKLFSLWNFPSQTHEIEMAASVINWLPLNLQEVLQQYFDEGVKANLGKLAISGHSRGGKSAFALALGISKTTLTVKISALIAVDPVAGKSKNWRTEPHILTYKPNSLNLSIPVTVIGTGLGNHTRFFVPVPCAPNYVNHQQFFGECKESSHFVIADYGHMQMLNDFEWDLVANIMSRVCAFGDGSKSIMRRTLGGIMVAFLDTYFRGEGGEYFAIMANPNLAPTKLIVDRKDKKFERTYAQV